MAVLLQLETNENFDHLSCKADICEKIITQSIALLDSSEHLKKVITFSERCNLKKISKLFFEVKRGYKLEIGSVTIKRLF